jgi:hypothetical protein
MVLTMIERLCPKFVGNTFVDLAKNPDLQHFGWFLLVLIVISVSVIFIMFFTELQKSPKFHKLCGAFSFVATILGFLLGLTSTIAFAASPDEVAGDQVPVRARSRSIDLNREYEPSSSSGSEGTAMQVDSPVAARNDGASASSAAGISHVVPGIPVIGDTGEPLVPIPGFQDVLNSMYKAWQQEYKHEKVRLLGPYIEPNTTPAAQRLLVERFLRMYLAHKVQNASLDQLLPTLSQLREDLLREGSHSGVYQDFRKSLERP